MKLYAERDIENLPTYPDHVSAMTSENLRSKSDIAAELAFRDNEIGILKNRLELLEEDIEVYHMAMDGAKAPRSDYVGREYSMFGRALHMGD